MGSVDRKARRVFAASIESLESRRMLTSIPVDGTQVPLTGVKVGDTITVQSYVSTATDPNEDGEGENVVITGNGPPSSSGSTFGLDASHYNGNVDWQSLAASGTKFGFIKATDGASFGGDDKKFYLNYLSAELAGVTPGAYAFARLLLLTRLTPVRTEAHCLRTFCDEKPWIGERIGTAEVACR